MNVQNVSSLANQLKSLGFANLDYSLAKRICFRPRAFCLPYRFEKGEYTLNFQLSFEKAAQSGDYALTFYDAAFQKTASVEQTIAGFDVAALSQQMSQIDWKKTFDFSEQKTGVSGDKTAFSNELKIDSIMGELEWLQSSPEGQRIAAALKSSHWSGSSYQEVFGGLVPQKIKAEISQRFYVIEGEPGITVEEAFRYLQNRWLEKGLLAMKKKATETEAASVRPEKGSGLLRKKRSRHSWQSKSDK